MIELTKEELDRLTEQALNPNKVVLPCMNAQDQHSSLIGGSIAENIVEETVSNVIVKKVDDIKIPSYLIKCADKPTIKGCWDAIIGMLGGGDTTVYVQGVTGEIREIGTGSGMVLYKVLEQVVHGVLGEDFEVYKNSTGKFEKINKRDISLVRLNL